jgi:nucleotide-binding universal stress UspA family protein
MYGSLLVPLDGSAFSEHALPLALSIARRAGATFHLLYVQDLLPFEGAGQPPFPPLSPHLRQHELDYLHGVVERLRQLAPVTVMPLLLEGEVAATIRSAAEGTGVDLVVMTTHGRGPLGRMWLGSVADRLLRDLPVPLLLVRPTEAAPELGREATVANIFLPLDGTPLAEQMLAPARDLGAAMGAAFTLFRAVRPVVPLGFPAEGLGIGEATQSLLDQAAKTEDRLQETARAYLQRLATRWRAEGLSVRTAVAVEAQPAVAILKEAAATTADVIALATHGRHGVSRLFLGSVADKVIRAASVPVLVHRPASS